MQPDRSQTRYAMFGVLGAATLVVIMLGWVVARDFRQSAEATNQLYNRFGEGLDLIDNILFETGEVRRVMLYALHTSDANRQLDYVDQSRSGEVRVRRLLESQSPLLSTARTRSAREAVGAAWADYLKTRDEVIGLILEGSLREAVHLDEAVGTAEFNRVRQALATLKAGFEADAAEQVEAQRARSARATTRLAELVLSALLLVAVGVYLVNRRNSLEVVLRVKSDFLTTMSHELRTPLTGVIGITDLLWTASVPPAQRELIRMLRTNATSLLALVNNVLDYSRIDAGLMTLTPRRFSLFMPVEDALDSVSEVAARKRLSLGYVIDPRVPDVITDEDRVRQVLLNLLSNAVKYTETGEVVIRAWASVSADGIATVTIAVRDTGIGIPEDMQERVFQWFSRIEPAGAQRIRGTGLGLAISDRLSRLLGGSMAVDSRPGQGSTFTFVFRGKAAAATPVELADFRGKRVLTVLHTGIVGEQILSFLRTWQMRIVPFEGGRPPQADVVIVDRSARDEDHEMLLRNRSGWGLDGIAVITIDDMHSEQPVLAHREQVVSIPVRRQALRDALRAALAPWTAAEEPAPETRQAFAGQALAVLVVEDNEPNRRVIRLMLNELGLSPDEAANGGEAIDAAARRSYDVILMDLQMPDLDGLEATRRIREQERSHRATIVALTANVFESDVARCMAAGMDAYLQKPLKLDALGDALSAVVRRA